MGNKPPKQQPNQLNNSTQPQPQQFLCQRQSCREMIDDNCCHVNAGVKLCALCFLAVKNNSNRKSTMLKVDDDDFLFDMSP